VYIRGGALAGEDVMVFAKMVDYFASQDCVFMSFAPPKMWAAWEMVLKKCKTNWFIFNNVITVVRSTT
jgi:hypothetical protein